MAKKRSLTKTSQLFQEESSYKRFCWNKVAAGFSAPVNWIILELWTLYLTYVIRSAGEIFWRTYTYIYYISEISIEHDWESASLASLARWITWYVISNVKMKLSCYTLTSESLSQSVSITNHSSSVSMAPSPQRANISISSLASWLILPLMTPPNRTPYRTALVSLSLISLWLV